MPKRLLYVVGTRPEIIRSAKILSHFNNNLKGTSILVNTGQHYDPNLMNNFFAELDIREPDYNLKQNHTNGASQTAGIISEMAKVIRLTKCNAVIIYGDTNSSLAAAIAAVKENVKIVHIESGCRSFDFRMQEEHNRRMIDHISNLCLSVSDVCTSNLINERVPGLVSTIGDPHFDVFAEVYSEIQKSQLHNKVSDRSNPIGLLTIHRAENVDDPQRISTILDSISKASEVQNFIWKFPIHPRTRKHLVSKTFPRIEFIEPVGYRDLLNILDCASLCITDSGGLQKEAFWTNTPCITIRPSTEWPETIVLGKNLLIDDPTHLAPIISNDLSSHFSSLDCDNPYGPVGASQRAADRISEWIESGK